MIYVFNRNDRPDGGEYMLLIMNTTKTKRVSWEQLEVEVGVLLLQ